MPRGLYDVALGRLVLEVEPSAEVEAAFGYGGRVECMLDVRGGGADGGCVGSEEELGAE